MLETENPSTGLLFFSILFRSDLFSEQLFCHKLETQFGMLISHTPEFNPLAHYYAKEMGPSDLLKRIFFVSTAPQSRESLLSVKLQSLVWEREWSVEGKRMVNVDVGFISADNFLLATTKNYAHRVYIGQKIFADLTYQCTDGRYQTLPWTYPDYRDQPKLDFISWCRSYLLMLSKTESF